MAKKFPDTAKKTRKLAHSLVRHLRRELQNTKTRKEWTKKNLTALRSFPDTGYKLKHFPPKGNSRKGAFLWDYIAYQQNTGILIAAESEYDSKLEELRDDFDKLLYVRSPIKVFLFWLKKDSPRLDTVVKELTECIKWCSQYSPGEVFILYCRTWREKRNGPTGDHVWWLQIDGEPCHRDDKGKCFEAVPD